MNFRLAVTVNTALLLRYAAEMVAMLGGLEVETVSRRVLVSVLALLRPVESATRRLIAILAHGLTVPERATRAMPKGGVPAGTGERVPSFPLLDRRRKVGPKGPSRVPGFEPNVRFLDDDDPPPPVPQAPSPDDAVEAATMIRRVRALLGALEDMPREARRLARALSRKTLPIRAMRPGRPPGHRAPSASGRWWHPVDEVLADCHELALMALAVPAPDT